MDNRQSTNNQKTDHTTKPIIAGNTADKAKTGAPSTGKPADAAKTAAPQKRA